jgi:hypothetical protein
VNGIVTANTFMSPENSPNKQSMSVRKVHPMLSRVAGVLPSKVRVIAERNWDAGYDFTMLMSGNTDLHEPSLTDPKNPFAKQPKQDTATQMESEDAELGGCSFYEATPDLHVSDVVVNTIEAGARGLGRVIKGIGSKATGMIATVVEHDYADSSTPIKIERQQNKGV